MSSQRRVVVITGGTGGIGFEMAKHFARLGHRLVLNGLEQDGERVCSELSKKLDVPVLFSPEDITSEKAVDNLFSMAESQFGRVEILINNAGIQHVSPIETFSLDKWNRVLSVNLTASFMTSKRAWPEMKKGRWGRIIQVSSVHGLVGSEFKSAYVAAKHGLIGLSKVLALEGAPHGITCNAICPGYVLTPIVEGQIDDQARAHDIPREEVISKVILAKHSIKEFVTPQAVASMAMYLASDEASAVTGAAFALDGGWTAQ